MAPSTINEYKRELLLLGVRLPPSSAKLADYQALLEEEDREATERLESARAASHVGAFDSCPSDEVVGGFFFYFE